MSPLPPPDPAAGHAAAAAAEEARDQVEAQLAAGELDLAGLFAAVDAETDRRAIGHMHVKAALKALPRIGDVKADRILAELGIPHGEHLDVLGSVQRAALIEKAAAA